MNSYYIVYSENRGPRIQAWTAHYVAKGCADFKARDLARRKCERKVTWP